MPVYRVPAIYDKTTRRIRPATCCEKVSPEYFSFNVGCIIYADGTNSLHIKDNKLICTVVSAQVDNMLKYGNDGGAYLDCNDVLSNSGTNLLHVAAADKKLILTREHIDAAGYINRSSTNEALEALISSDEYNALTIGSDGKLFVRKK